MKAKAETLKLKNLYCSFASLSIKASGSFCNSLAISIYKLGCLDKYKDHILLEIFNSQDIFKNFDGWIALDSLDLYNSFNLFNSLEVLNSFEVYDKLFPNKLADLSYIKLFKL